MTRLRSLLFVIYLKSFRLWMNRRTISSSYGVMSSVCLSIAVLSACLSSICPSYSQAAEAHRGACIFSHPYLFQTAVRVESDPVNQFEYIRRKPVQRFRNEGLHNVFGHSPFISIRYADHLLSVFHFLEEHVDLFHRVIVCRRKLLPDLVEHFFSGHVSSLKLILTFYCILSHFVVT